MLEWLENLFHKINVRLEAYLGRFDQEDKEFLPPSVEILETPPSPMGRALIYAIIGLFIIGFGWACIGEVDEVVVAQGKVIPAGYTKLLQAEDKGIVSKINVKNGQRVEAGQVLLTLDPTVSEADLQTIKKDLAYYDMNLLRLTAELESKPLVLPKEYEEKDKNQQMALYESRMSEKAAKLSFLEAQIRQKRDAVTINSASVHKNEALLTIARDQEQATAELEKQNAIGHFTVLQYRSQRIELEQNVIMGRAQLSAALTDVNAAEQAKTQYLAQWHKELQADLLDFRKEYNRLKESERKAELKNRFIELKAPVAGVVHQLAVHTVGAIVTEAQALLSLVPEGTPMEVEAYIANKDIGFVRVGMPVEVKVETFDFQKFGTLKGKVTEVSPDAIDNKEQGTVYRVMVQLDKEALLYDKQELKVYPGMNVNAEIKTRKKKIIDFFLEPFQTYKSEALRER